jgi:TRAP-type C4-dicarboxylate transport system permease small subunit
MQSDAIAKVAPSVVNFVYTFSRIINIIAMVTLVLMMFVTVSDIFMRYVVQKPILDSQIGRAHV